MKKKFSLIIKIVFNIFFFSLIMTYSIADDQPGCELVAKKLKEINYEVVPQDLYENFGFLFGEKLDVKKGEWSFKKIDNYFVVGKILDPILASEIKSGYKVIKLNGKQFDFNEDQQNIISNAETAEFQFQSNKGEIIEKSLKRYDYYTHTPKIDIKSINFNKIDTKNGNVEFNLEFDVSSNYTAEYHKELWNALQGSLIFKTEDGDYSYYVCDYSEEEFSKIKIPKPFHGFKILNLSKSNKNLALDNSFKLTPYAKVLNNDDEYLMVEEFVGGFYSMKNKFNLKTFPFDRQTISIKIIDDFQRIPNKIITESGLTYLAMDQIIKNNDIPGWNTVSFEFNNFQYQDSYAMKDDFSDGIELSLVIERKHSYYLYKVILPIILILSVCWLVVWIDPKELEARLTVTIVCLLSLIAYNFVIDSELPKLEYLTVLDWIILTSYVYAVIPNILSVVSFRVQKNNKLLSDKIEIISTRYGALSYLLIIFLIILVNANLNVENSTAIISWMTGF